MTDHKFTDEEVIKALDICDKYDFLYGQRAGRELWSKKPVEVQNDDVRKFSEDMQFVKALINRQKAEIEDLDSNLKAAYAAVEEKSKRLREVLPIVAELKAEAIKEFAQELRKVLCLEYRGRFSLDDELAEYKVQNAIEWVVEKMTEGKE